MIQAMKSRSDLVDNEGQKFLAGLDHAAMRIAHEMSQAMKSRLPASPQKPKIMLTEILSRNLLELGLEADRKVEWLARELYSRLFWGLLTDPNSAALRDVIGIKTGAGSPKTVNHSDLTNAPAVEVHSVRMAARRGNRGQIEREYVVELTQTRRGYLTREEQKAADQGERLKQPADFKFRRGCTLLIDAETFEIRRVIRASGDICDDRELERMRSFLAKRSTTPQNAFTGSAADVVRSETFAHLHRNYG
jgi:hypothetical protein